MGRRGRVARAPNKSAGAASLGGLLAAGLTAHPSPPSLILQFHHHSLSCRCCGRLAALPGCRAWLLLHPSRARPPPLLLLHRCRRAWRVAPPPPTLPACRPRLQRLCQGCAAGAAAHVACARQARHAQRGKACADLGDVRLCRQVVLAKGAGAALAAKDHAHGLHRSRDAKAGAAGWRARSVQRGILQALRERHTASVRTHAGSRQQRSGCHSSRSPCHRLGIQAPHPVQSPCLRLARAHGAAVLRAGPALAAGHLGGGQAQARGVVRGWAAVAAHQLAAIPADLQGRRGAGTGPSCARTAWTP